MSQETNRQALRPAAGGMLSLKIEDETARLKAKPEWPSSDRLAASLVKDDALNILLMVLKKEARLAEHRTRGPIAVQCSFRGRPLQCQRRIRGTEVGKHRGAGS